MYRHFSALVLVTKQNIVAANTCRFVRQHRSWGLSKLRNLNYMER